MHLPYRQRYFIRNQYFVTKHTNAFSELLREPGENSQICRKLAGKAKNRYFAFANGKNHSNKLLGSSVRQSNIAITNVRQSGQDLGRQGRHHYRWRVYFAPKATLLRIFLTCWARPADCRLFEDSGKIWRIHSAPLVQSHIEECVKV